MPKLVNLRGARVSVDIATLEFGEGVVHWLTILSVIAFPLIVIAHTLLARHGERQMLDKFGEEHRRYQRRVPMFIPRIEGGRPQEA